MTIVVFLFWLSFFILAYAHFGYGLFVLLISPIRLLFSKTAKKTDQSQLPAVTLIIAAYNEEEIIEEKIKNTLSIDYPADKLNVIYITDGSTDQSVQIISRNTSALLLHHPVRQGKYAAIKRAMRLVQTPIVIFSDANAMLNKECISRMIRHYYNPKIGGVAGEKRLYFDSKASTVSKTEALYWRYESILKQADNIVGNVVGAAGELFSIRTSLFKELDDDIILDDFIISMQVCLQGFKLAYEPNAFAIELGSASIREEAKRKIRIAAGAFQAIGYLKPALNFFRYPLLSFQYLSRRLFRWVLCPPMLIVLLISNTAIVLIGGSSFFYWWFLGGQLFFYLMAFLGWLCLKTEKQPGVLSIPFYFVFMNLCLIKGAVIFLNGKGTVLWEKSIRQYDFKKL